MIAKEILRYVAPPFLWQLLRFFKRRWLPSAEGLAYAPSGWATPLPHGPNQPANWNAFMASQRADCEALIALCRAGTPLSSNPVDLLRQLLFGYVLGLAAHQKDSLSVLDYGSSLGDHYWLATALVPRIALDYHCKELPAVAEVGREVTPHVTWHTDDACLDRGYDLIMFSSSLEYLPDWREVIGRAALATRGYLFIPDTPVVRHVDEYVSVQRLQGLFALYQPLNNDTVVAAVEQAGLHLVCEIDMGPHPLIENAPEQPVCVGWLFERRPAA